MKQFLKKTAKTYFRKMVEARDISFIKFFFSVTI
jgi:hypothetical protein